MSILPVGWATSIAINMLSIEIAVTDVSYVTVKGIDKQVVDGTRTIFGSVDPSGGRKLQQVFGGSASDGNIMIYLTEDELHFLDTFNPEDPRKQSFVKYGAYMYRVLMVADWTAQAGCRIYLAERHLTQDLV